MIRALSFLLFLWTAALSWGQHATFEDCHEQLGHLLVAIDDWAGDGVHRAAEFQKKVSDARKGACHPYVDFLLGKLAYYLGDLETSQRNFGEAFQYYQQQQDEDGMVQLGYLIGLNHVEVNDYLAADALLDTILAYPEALSKQSILHEVMELRAMRYIGDGKQLEGVHYLKKGVLEAVAKGDDQCAVRLLNQIPTIYQSLGMIDSAIAYYPQLLELKKQLQESANLSSDYLTLGSLQSELGHYDEAQSSFVQAREYAEEMGDTFSLTNVLIEMGEVYLQQGMPSLAMEITQNAANITVEKKMRFAQGQCYDLLGRIYTRIDSTELAIPSLINAFNVFKSLGLKKQMAEVQMTLIKYYGKDEMLLATEQELREALAQSQLVEDRISAANIQLMLADLLIRNQQSSAEVKRLLLQTKTLLGEQKQNTSAQQEYYRLLSRHYENQGNNEAALQAFKEYKSLSDGILTVEIAKVVRELDAVQASKRKDEEISRQNAVLQRRKTLNLLLGMGLVFLMGVIVVSVMINQRNRQLSQEKYNNLQKEREAQLLRAMVNGEERERVRIARDLHDGLGSLIATAKMRVDTLADQVPALQSMDNFKKTEELINDAYYNVREISHNMMPGTLSRHGLENAVKHLCEAIEQAHPQLTINYITYGLELVEDEVLGTNVYRIIQELLTNVVKHAEATEVIVQLTKDDGIVEIIVEDNGKGFLVEGIQSRLGIGLESIRSRVMYLSGELDIFSRISEGASFTIHIPLLPENKLDS